MGSPPGTIVNPVPEIVAELMETAEVPVEVSVRNWVADVLTVTFPKATLPELTVNWGLGVAVPVPLRATTAALPVEELLPMINCPVTGPVPAGLNRTCRGIV